MSIFVTGDTHGAEKYGADGYLRRFNTDSFHEQKELGKEDFAVICGDFGGIWDTKQICEQRKVVESRSEKYGLDWLEEKSFTTLFVPGNHENYDRLTGIRDEALLNGWLFGGLDEGEKRKFRTGYPRKDWHGGFVREIRPHVLMLEPGVFDLCGKKCFAYGGGQSHDIAGGVLNPADYLNEQEFKKAYRRISDAGICFRVKGVSWWDQELPGEDEERQALEALERVGYEVDFIFTHECAASDQAYFGHGEQTRINAFLEQVKQKTSYRHWFFGHLHDNRSLPGGKDHLLYEQIVQIA